MARRRRGLQGGPQLEKQQRYAQLIGQGVSNAQACRIVGIDRRTGTRWKYGRTVLNVGGGQERCTIADLRREGLGVRAIAARLSRAPSTISRELRRNLGAYGRYRQPPRTGTRCNATPGQNPTREPRRSPRRSGG